MLKGIFTHYKTTAAGIALVAGAIADLANQVANWQFDMNHLQADCAALVTGYGLIMAKDFNKT